MEMQFTSGQFNADLFAMANAKDFQNKEEEIPVSVALELDDDGTTASIETNVSIIKSLQLPGLTKVELVDGQTLASGTYAVTETTSGEDGNQVFTTTFSFSKDDGLSSMEVTYFEKRMVNILNITNDTAAIGELIAKWPVYATGDEADAAGVKGYVIMKMYRCRATAMPGFDTSYKSAATNSVTFSALEPKNRADRAVYGIAYVENAAAAVNEPTNTAL